MAYTLQNMPVDSFPGHYAFSALIRDVRDKVVRASLERVAQAEGPSVSLQTEIEGGSGKPVTDATISKYQVAFDKITPGAVPAGFLSAVATLFGGLARENRLNKQITERVRAWGHSRSVLLGCHPGSTDMITGANLVLLDDDSPLSGVLHDIDRIEFTRLCTSIAKRHPAVTLVSNSERHRAPLDRYLAAGWLEEGDIRAIGQVSPPERRAAFDPIAGARSLSEALMLADALCTNGRDAVAAAWGILIVNTAAQLGRKPHETATGTQPPTQQRKISARPGTGDNEAEAGTLTADDEREPVSPMRMWRALERASQRQALGAEWRGPFTATSEWFRQSGLREALLADIPPGAHIRAALSDALTSWHEDYVAAIWQVDVANEFKDGHRLPPWDIDGTEPELFGDRPAPVDLWYFNENRHPNLPKVLHAQGIGNITLSSAGLQLATTYRGATYRWFPVGLGTGFGLLLDDRGDWHPIQTGV